MPGSDPQTGDVYYYPYVWKRQPGGFPEKDRPCCVILRLKTGSFRDCDTFLLALSQSGVPKDGYGIKLPEEVVRRLKRLDSSKDTHLITSEWNSDTADHPSFEDLEYLGALPREIVLDVLKGLVEHLRRGTGEVMRKGSAQR